MHTSLSILALCLLGNTLFAQDSLLSKSDIVKLDFNILAAKRNKLASKKQGGDQVQSTEREHAGGN